MHTLTAVPNTDGSSKDSLQSVSECAAEIGLTTAICCVVIAPLCIAVGVVASCLITRKKLAIHKRPLPEPPVHVSNPTHGTAVEMEVVTPNPHDAAVYEYIPSGHNKENIGTIKNEAYGHCKRTVPKPAP